MKAALPPLVPGLPLLGNALDLVGDPAPFLVKNYLRFGPVFRVNAAHHRLLVVAGPEANIFFMKGAGAHALENRRAFAVMKKELNGQNLIFAQDGQRHREVRHLLRPAYSREMLDRNLPSIGEALEVRDPNLSSRAKHSAAPADSAVDRGTVVALGPRPQSRKDI